jgi:hypothetical protein
MFPNRQLYEFGYCAIFVKNVEPVELLERSGGHAVRPIALTRSEVLDIEAFGEDVSEGDVPGVDFDQLQGAGIIGGDGTLVRAGAFGDWSFAIEGEGSYLAGDSVLESVSRGTAAFSVRDSESGSCWISYAENGDILSSFDPLFPRNDYGKRPEVLERLTGHVEVIENGDRAESYSNAVQAIQRALRCSVPQEVDEGRLLTVRIPEGH